VGTEPDRDFFLRAGAEWLAVADALRAAGVPGGDPALGVWREAAWCHLLFADGNYPALVLPLRAVLANVLGVPAPDAPAAGANRAEVLAAAADIFGRLRLAVSARYPLAFGRPAAA
jgi:hypothetical protein